MAPGTDHQPPEGLGSDRSDNAPGRCGPNQTQRDGTKDGTIGLINRVVPADRLAAEVDALADRLARTPPEVMAPTKRMLNRAMDAAGFRVAVEAGIDLGAIINAADTPEQREWDTIVRRDGLKAALAWRDRRYDERLSESGRAGPAPETTDPDR